tara:strand:- start:145 stop:777 length:633 start_codon:yes stop_codon:yes gene_type:complete
MTRTTAEHVKEHAQSIVDELKTFLVNKMADSDQDSLKLQSLRSALRPVENLINGIVMEDMALPSPSSIETVDDVVDALLLLAEKGWLYPLHDRAQMALANKGLSAAQIDAVSGIVDRILEVDFSDSVYEDMHDLALLAADPERELGALCAELEAWQAKNGLAPMCALEQIHCLEHDDPRQTYLHAFCERWDAATERVPIRSSRLMARAVS